MPTLYMLVGVPGSGKTTWIEKNKHNAVVLSTDNYIERYAMKTGKTYNDMFKELIGVATKQMEKDLAYAVEENRDIIWDQTNLTAKSRKSKLSKIPNNYKKIAVFFSVPSDLRDRLASRPGKNIPEPVIISMINQLQPPTKEEGFDEVVAV
jgi:predicted kinase